MAHRFWCTQMMHYNILKRTQFSLVSILVFTDGYMTNHLCGEIAYFGAEFILCVDKLFQKIVEHGRSENLYHPQ